MRPGSRAVGFTPFLSGSARDASILVGRASARASGSKPLPTFGRELSERSPFMRVVSRRRVGRRTATMRSRSCVGRCSFGSTRSRGREERSKGLVGGQPSPEHRTNSQVERVGQARRVVAPSREVGEQAPNKSSSPRRMQIEQKLHLRLHSGHGRCEPVVHIQGSEDKDPSPTPIPNPIRDQFARLKEGDRAERAGHEGGWCAEKKLASRDFLAGRMSQLDGGFHRPRSVERLREARAIASRTSGATFQP